jgi:hypothetical protein
MYVTHFTSRDMPCVPFAREFRRHLLLVCSHAVSGSQLCHMYVCQYSNMSIHMINLAHPAGRLPPGDAT